ncbi:MAG: ABC transporter substrate-binding protein, partial [Muribaculaceae bacterium]|nr:ABC transporter substrate-binding protein [Muribaculaceae bacterium]
MNKLIYLFIIFIWLLLPGCSGSNNSRTLTSDKEQPLRYAELLHIFDHDDYTVAELSDPWNKNKLLCRLILVPDSIDLPADLPAGTVIRTPITKIVSGTAPHAALLDELGCRQSVVGVCEPEYMNLSFVTDGVESGRIKNCGSGMNPDLETLINLQPQAILLSPFENSGGFSKIENTGIAVIPVADYMEKGPLARAEWIKFYGLLM